MTMELTQHDKRVSHFYSQIADMNHKYNGGFLTFGVWETETGDPIPPPFCYGAVYDSLLAGIQIEKHHSILEVACGQAAGMVKIHEKYGCSITGLELSVGNIEIAKRRLDGSSLTVTHGSATSMPYEENSFDFVLCVEGMPHFKTREAFFHEAYRVLKPGGKLLMGDCVTLTPLPTLSFPLWMIAYATINIWVSDTENFSYDLNSYRKKLTTSGFKNTRIKQIGSRVYPQYCRHNLSWSIIQEQVKVRGLFVGYIGGPLIDFLLWKSYEYGLVDYIMVATEKKTD